jgi:hypothetical protein
LATLNTVGLEMEPDEFVSVQIGQYSIANPSLPSVLVTGIEDVDYNVAFKKQAVQCNVVVQAFASETHDESGQKILDKLLMGANSVRKLIDADPTLGNSVHNAYVSSQSGHKVFNLVNTKVLGAEWTVQIVLTD